MDALDLKLFEAVARIGRSAPSLGDVGTRGDDLARWFSDVNTRD